MKFIAKTNLNLLLLCAFLFSLQSCLKDDCEGKQTFIEFTPVYKQIDEIRQAVQVSSARELCKPGKLFYYNDYIFVNEFRAGVHVIDNRNSENPTNVAFIEIPGNVDVAVKGNVMYADNYIDLVTLDITNPENPTFKNRAENVFNSISLNEELGHLVYYQETEVTLEIDCTDPNFNRSWWGVDDLIFVNQAEIDVSGSVPTLEPTRGIAGSLASFSVINDWLYVIDENRIDVFSLADACNPTFSNQVEIEWNIETLFPYEEWLFIGSQSGMFIYSLATPNAPSFVAEFRHARSCDPVIVKDDIAYVTLRDGTTCQGFINQLDVIDVSDVFNPELLASFPMDNPHGLSIKDNTLFICEGAFGMKAFDISELETIGENIMDRVTGVHAYDVIALPHKDVALMIGDDGFYQYDISTSDNLKRMSVISADENNCD